MRPPLLDIKVKGIPRTYISDFYYWMLKTSWLKFLTASVFIYLGVNSFFALVYFLAGDVIINAQTGSYWDAFIFSFQTSATIGYGHFLPKTNLANLIVIFDTFSGIIFVAFVTGMAYAKFSRPSARVLFSNKVLITNYDGKKTLLFRLGNGRSTHIANAEIKVVALLPYVTKEGFKIRKIYDLELVRSHTPAFALTWLIQHPINEQSPLYQMSEKDFLEKDLRLMISFTGIDDVLAQPVHTNHIYSSNEESFKFGGIFADVSSVDSNGQRVIDLSKFHQIL